MFAVVRTGGKQYRVQAGRNIRVDRLPGEPGAAIELADVLMMGDGSDVTIGAPNIAGARVMGTIAEQGRAKKIIVFRYKSKTRSRKKTGHRQHFTMIHVDDILAPGESPKPKAEPAATSEEAPKRRGRGRAKAEATTAPAEPAAAENADAVADVTATPEATADEAPAPDEKPKRGRRKAE